jgi:hypothetical protein
VAINAIHELVKKLSDSLEVTDFSGGNKWSLAYQQYLQL